MPSVTANRYRALVTAAFLIAVLAGVWRGFASCGGYAWHSQGMLAALAFAALMVALLPLSQGPSFLRRAFLAVAVLGTFFAARALSVPFYPFFPGFGDYFRQVGIALFTWSC